MPEFKLHIGIKSNTAASIGDGVLDLYFLDIIANPEYYNWDSGKTEEYSLLAAVIEQIKYYNPSKIICHIDSMGGSVSVGMGIYNYLKDYPAKVECKILNWCASIATVIACAANKGKVSMPKNGFYIIHEASNEGFGRSSDLREAADVADMCTTQMCEIYSERTGISVDELKSMIAPGDYWMTGTEALAKGFVDSLYNDATVSVTARVANIQKVTANIPTRILELKDEPEEAATEETTFFKQVTMELKSMVTAALDSIRSKKIEKVTAENLTAQVAEAISTPLAEMVTGIEEQLTAEVVGITERVTASVTESLTASITAAVDAKYKGEMDLLKKELENVTADLQKIAGGATASIGKEKGEKNDASPSLSGSFRD